MSIKSYLSHNGAVWGHIVVGVLLRGGNFTA
nr:MAG TPA: hypothetical protein [Caudoviricetes sp.]